jgi:hypothetical protein
MKEGLGVVGQEFFLSKNVKNKPDLFEPPLIPLLAKEGRHIL